MKMTIARALALSLWIPSAALAVDKWEGGITSDNTIFSVTNQLLNGTRQTHDIEGTADIDYMIVGVKTGHSYEARMDSTSIQFDEDQVNGVGVHFARTDRINNIVQTAVTPDGVWPTSSGNISSALVLRWTAVADEFQTLRVAANLTYGPGQEYDVLFRDTTYSVPRWNNSATQVTVFVIQNDGSSPIAGSVNFYNSSGTLLQSQALSLAARGVQVFNTASIPALAGLSGSALVTHDGGYGQLSGKAVAVEPATGFTFDTQLDPIPY